MCGALTAGLYGRMRACLGAKDFGQAARCLVDLSTRTLPEWLEIVLWI